MHKLLSTENKIKFWLRKYNIRRYTLIPSDEYGWMVDVPGNVSLSGKNLDKIEVKFNSVGGQFFCDNNNLTTLLGCPKEAGGFYCYYNSLTSLEYCPQKVQGDFDCRGNKIENLEYMPQFIGGYIDCDYNLLPAHYVDICDPETLRAMHYAEMERKIMNETIERKKYTKIVKI